MDKKQKENKSLEKREDSSARSQSRATRTNKPKQVDGRISESIIAKNENAEAKIVTERTWTGKIKRTVHKSRIIEREKTGFDKILFAVIIVMLCFGTIMIFSASYAWSQNDYGDSYYVIKKHLQNVALGFFAMFIAMRVDYKWYEKLTIPYFAVSYLLLLAVPFVGKVVNGAKRWIVLGPIQIQPTEFMKLGIVIMLAYYISRNVTAAQDITSDTMKRRNASRYKGTFKENFRIFIREVFIPFAILGLVCATTAVERHMSGTIILFLIGMVVIFFGKVSLKWICALAGVGGGAAAVLILFTGYTSDRVNAWLNPEAYAQTDGWQIIQSLYAIGSGGIFGVGIGNSNQKHMYLPEPQNDFIFAIICEELGFIGALSVLALFAVLIWRGIAVSLKAPDTFSSLVAMGITGKIAIQAILNIAVVTNTIPNTGISLPFFSYGGSALVILMGEVGILLSISRYSYQRKN